MNSLETKDYVIFLIYFVMVAGYGWWIYKKKKSESSGTRDYFLAEGSLTWWAIGASLISSNISAEQFVGMSGSGFKIGLAIATYEWMAALTLIIVAVFFIPVYLKNKIYTMPQFLLQRYNGTVAMVMAVFWLLLYVVVNLTSILYLGAIAVSGVSGIDLNIAMIGLAVFAIFITLGGMKVIGYTSVVQVLFLILGGLATTYIALNQVAVHFGGSGILSGFKHMLVSAPDHFHMILPKTNPNYLDLPGLSVLIGGMWIVNLNYWGCNQYIVQRALGADLKTARTGILFAGFLKLLMPVLIVVPGIAAFVLFKEKSGAFASISNPDNSYPVLLNLLPVGLKGLSFAALSAAVVASLAGKVNSIATIFTLDIYKNVINKEASEKKLVIIGKVTIIISMILGIVIAPHLGMDKQGGFQYIQEYTGFVSPGIFAMFILGFFWKKTTSNAALFATIGGFVFSVILKVLPSLMDLSFLYPVGFAVRSQLSGIYEIPFLDRMGIVFVVCVVGMYLISLIETRKGVKPAALEIDTKMFKSKPSFIVGSVIIIGILAALYTIFW